MKLDNVSMSVFKENTNGKKMENHFDSEYAITYIHRTI